MNFTISMPIAPAETIKTTFSQLIFPAGLFIFDKGPAPAGSLSGKNLSTRDVTPTPAPKKVKALSKDLINSNIFLSIYLIINQLISLFLFNLNKHYQIKGINITKTSLLLFIFTAKSVKDSTKSVI